MVSRKELNSLKSLKKAVYKKKPNVWVAHINKHNRILIVLPFAKFYRCKAQNKEISLSRSVAKVRLTSKIDNGWLGDG